VTPYQIKILLHYRCCCDDFDHKGAPIWPETRDWMIREGLLERAPEQFDVQWVLSERGIAYCDSLQRVPLPEQIWITRWPEDGK
jgi:hypothetical protein